MPFTLAHPAAILPLRRIPYVATMPLIIGTLIPDLMRILPDSMLYRIPGFWRLPGSHTLAGTVFTDLPFGYALLIALLVLRIPLLSLLWEPHRTHIGDAIAEFVNTRRWWLIAIPSLLLGAWTHLAWDAFTHEGHLVTTHLSSLQNEVFPGEEHPLPIYRVLQYACSILGMVAVAMWYRSALGRSRASVSAQTTSLQKQARRERYWRRCVLTSISLISFAGGVAVAVRQLPADASFYDVTSAVLKSTMLVFGALYLLASCVFSSANIWRTARIADTE